MRSSESTRRAFPAGTAGAAASFALGTSLLLGLLTLGVGLLLPTPSG